MIEAGGFVATLNILLDTEFRSCQTRKFLGYSEDITILNYMFFFESHMCFTQNGSLQAEAFFPSRYVAIYSIHSANSNGGNFRILTSLQTKLLYPVELPNRLLSLQTFLCCYSIPL